MPVALHAGRDRFVRETIAVAQVPDRDVQTRDEAFQVPFPRTDRGFVEVVDVEHERALGRREAAEIQQVTIAADLEVKAAVRGARQVMRLDDRAAPIERERRCEHAPVAQRHECVDTAAAALTQQTHGIALDVADLGMGAARGVLARIAAECTALCEGFGWRHR